MNPTVAFDELADAILDGTPIDWRVVDLTISTGTPEDKALIDQLKTLEALRFQRTKDRLASSGEDAAQADGWHWGHLRVFERIGQGAYGDVYRAFDTRLDREVALKLLPPDEPRATRSDSKVIEEGRLLARVRHANVVTIYGAERIDGRVGLWMEFIKGRTLEEALRDGRKFSAAEVTRLGIELCRAVSAVHAAGLLHRDIKTQNVMLDEADRLVLMDFGTGRELDATDNSIAGTPLYLAPEVLSGSAATPQSDSYSIGVVLFRLLTNTYPVSAKTLVELQQAHATGAATGRQLDRADIPHRLRRVLARALDADPSRRHATAEELADALVGTVRAPGRRLVAIATATATGLLITGGLGWSLGLREWVMPAPPPAIAVLPFRNVGSDLGNDDFVEGLTDEVIRNLAAIDGLQTRSQTSSFFFKDRARDLNDVGKQLNVDYVVEANVQRAGDRLRINAQLVRVSDQAPVWSDKFDRKLDDAFAIQEEISRAIVNNLRLKLGRGQRRYQLGAEATELYFRARAAVAFGAMAGGEAARPLFMQVIALAPDFAPAYAGLAYAYAASSWQVEAQANEQGLAGMRPAALKALELDPLLAEAHAAMGTTYARERNWEQAKKSFERAIELGPTWSNVYTGYSFTTLLPIGEIEKAEALLETAAAHDPLSVEILNDLGTAQFVGRKYEAALETLRQVNKRVGKGDNMLARSLIFAGRPAEAIAFWEGLSPRPNWELWLLPAYLQVGRLDDATRLAAMDRSQVAYRLARVHAAYGDKDRTFEALSRAVDEVPHRTAFLLVCPEMEFLRGDPRLAALRKRLNLP